MKKTLFAAAAALLLSGVGAQAQTLLAGYDFQNSNGTVAVAAPNTPTAFSAAFGVQLGTDFLYLDGTHGSSAFVTAVSGNELTAFGGTSVNAGPGFSTTTSTPSCLGLVSGTAGTGTYSADGKTLVFTLSMSGYTNLKLTFATQRSSSGFTGNAFSYSVDGGVTFLPANTTVAPAAAFATATADFSSITALNGAASVYIAYTLMGATGSNANNRLDNIQFTAVPEPATYAYVIAGLCGLALVTRRRPA